MVLRSGHWEAARIPTVMALVFNGLSLVAAVLQITAAPTLIAWLILGAASLVTLGSALALARRGG